MGHIGIGEKVQETSPITGMHVLVPSPYYMNSGCVLEYFVYPSLYYVAICICSISVFDSGVELISYGGGGQGPVMWVCHYILRHSHCSCSMVMSQAHAY